MARSLERLRKQYAAKPGDMMKGPRQGPPGRGATGKPKNAGQTIRRLMAYVGRYWYKLVLVLLCMLVTTVTSLCGGYLMAPIVDHLALAVNPDTVITMSPFEKIADTVLTKIPAGEYTVNMWSKLNPGYVCSFPLTVKDEAPPATEVAPTGPVMPERGMSEEEIWDIMMKPSVVIDDNGTFRRFILYSTPKAVKNAIRVANDFAKHSLPSKITDRLRECHVAVGDIPMNAPNAKA